MSSFADAEPLLQRGDGRGLVQGLRIEMARVRDAQLVQVSRHLGLTVIGREHDQRVLQPDLLVDMGEERRQGAVEPRQVVLGLQAGGAEEVPDVVGGGEAHREVVRHLVPAELLVVDERLREVQGQLVAGRAEGQAGGEVPVVRLAVRVRKGAAEAREVGLVRAVVAVAEQVPRRVLHQLPGRAGVGQRGLAGVPGVHPVGVVVVVVAAGDELAAGLGEPERLARVTGQRHRAAVLDRDGEDLRRAVEVHGELVAEGRGQDGRRRAAVHLRRLLGGVDLGAAVDVGAGGEQVVVRVLDVVDQPALLTVEPDVAHHAVRRGDGAGRQRHVADDGLGVGVLVVGVGVVHALVHEIAEPAVTVQVGVAPGQIAAQRVDRDLQHQPRLLRRSRHGPSWRQHERDGHETGAQSKGLHRLQHGSLQSTR